MTLALKSTERVGGLDSTLALLSEDSKKLCVVNLLCPPMRGHFLYALVIPDLFGEFFLYVLLLVFAVTPATVPGAPLSFYKKNYFL